MTESPSVDQSGSQDLAAAEPDGFLANAIAYLRETFPDQTADQDDDTLAQQVLDGCDRAAAHGLDSELDAMGFVDLQFRLGAAFDQDPDLPWAAEVLADAGLAPDAKVATLQNAWRFHMATESADGP